MTARAPDERVIVAEAQALLGPARVRPPVSAEELAKRRRLERVGRLLAWGGVAYHVLEAVLAVALGLAAGSIALVGFGADSAIESLAGLVVVWLFTGARLGSRAAERRAQRLIAVSFFVLAAYVAAESVHSLAARDEPDASWLGIALAAFTASTMPFLAAWKRRIGRRLDSAAAVREASQTRLCAYLSVALLVGLGANAVFGLWWMDPFAAIFIAVVAVKEGRESWRGDPCCDVC